MSEERIAKGKYVEFRYSILDEDDNIVERVDLPVSYVHGGSSGMIETIEEAMEGRAVGETVEVTLNPDEGFGEHDPELTYTDDLENVPAEFHFVGAEVPMQSESGEVKTFVVSKIEDGRLTIDGNHPLAGKIVEFRLEVLKIRDATEHELREGVAPLPTLH